MAELQRVDPALHQLPDPKELKAMPTQTGDRIEVLITSRRHLHELLTGAEELLRSKAITDGNAGILVTRYSPSRYTVALNDTVPFGETHELSHS
jgi:hypothetical protein